MTALFQKACETGKWPETVPDRMRVEKWVESMVGSLRFFHPIHKETWFK